MREGGFYPGALEKGLRSERALNLTLAEMYVQGVSTRKVKAVIEQLCGASVSSTQVSRASAQLDEVMQGWRNRPLGVIFYLYLDARYEKVRVDGQIRDVAVLVASGVDLKGKRTILGVSISLSGAEVHWRTFLQSLVATGVSGVRLIISDEHSGLERLAKRFYRWRSLSALPVSFAVNHQSLCAPQGYVFGSGCRYPYGFQCAGPGNCRCLPDQDRAEV